MGTTGALAKASAANPLAALVFAITAVGGTAGLKAYGASRDQDISAAFCGEFTSTQGNRQGCSIITQTNYNDIPTLNKLCAGGIEGNP